MGLKSFFKGLTGNSGGNGGGDDSKGKGAIKSGESVTYNGYVITPAPQPADGQFRIAGTIRPETVDVMNENESAGDASGTHESTNAHHFIRADLANNWDEACDLTVSKAKRIVDEQGNRLFNKK